MTAIKHILIPTDGSDGSLKAARFAGDLARALKAHTTIVMVHSEDYLLPYAWGGGEWPVIPAGSAVSVDEIRDAMQNNAAENELASTAKALGDVEPAARVVQLWGHAAEDICRYAVDHDVDLIVMGSRGRSGFTRLLLGSTSAQVAAHATCPVTIVH